MTKKIPNCKCFPLGIRVQEEYSYYNEGQFEVNTGSDWKNIPEINFCPKCGKEYVNDRV